MRMLAALLLGFAWFGSASPAAAPQAPSATGSQEGGLRARDVDTVIINNGARRDPARERLIPLLVEFNRMSHNSMSLQREQHGYIVVEDSTDPTFRFAANGGILYIFHAADADTLDDGPLSNGPRCAIQPGIYLTGALDRVRLDEMMAVEMSPVPADDALFARLCSSLGRSAESGGAAQAGTGASHLADLTNFDVISDGEGSAIIQFMPDLVAGAGYEQRIARDYWLMAALPIDPSQFDQEFENAFEAEQGRNRAREIEEQATRTGQAAISVPARRLGFNSSIEGRRRDAAETFGTLFAGLETDWNAYLDGAFVTLAGERRALSSAGALTPVVRRFGVAAVGAADFWAHLADSNDYMAGVNCAATLFLVRRQYALPADIPDYVRCARAETRARREVR